MVSFFYVNWHKQKDYIHDFKRLLHKTSHSDAPVICQFPKQNKFFRQRNFSILFCIFFFVTIWVPEWSICKWIICKIYEMRARAILNFIWWIHGLLVAASPVQCLLTSRTTWKPKCTSIPKKRAKKNIEATENAWRFFIFIPNNCSLFRKFLFPATLTLHIQRLMSLFCLLLIGFFILHDTGNHSIT